MVNRDSIVVIPDVHGRAFWKEVTKDKYSNYEIVFLGDYLDPYTVPEGITDEEALDNFKEILEFTKENTNRVHLLLGNHDLHYISFSDDTCRMYRKKRVEIFNLYDNNKSLFNIAYKWNNTLFTHAGITNKWVSNNEPLKLLNSNNVEDILNNMLHSEEWVIPDLGWIYMRNLIDTPLGDIGRSRGGYAPYGSCVWADAEEMFYHSAFYDIVDDKPKIELYQVTGHTRLIDEGKFIHPETNWWMCDSRRCFMWNEQKEELKLL